MSMDMPDDPFTSKPVPQRDLLTFSEVLYWTWNLLSALCVIAAIWAGPILGALGYRPGPGGGLVRTTGACTPGEIGRAPSLWRWSRCPPMISTSKTNRWPMS